jgi:hypothetical protein
VLNEKKIIAKKRQIRLKLTKVNSSSMWSKLWDNDNLIENKLNHEN